MSNTQPDPAQEPTPNDPADASDVPTPAQGDDDPIAEVARLRSELQKARKWEERAKTNAGAAKELEGLRKQYESDQERAVREAREAARSEVLGELGAERVADAFRVAAAGRGLDVDEVIDGINLAKFVGEDGTPDRDAVAAFVDRIAPEREPASPLDLGQGARGGNQVPGLNSTQLERDLKQKLGIS